MAEKKTKDKKKKPTKLQPQQKRVLKKLEKSPGVLVYHGLGSGKTLSALSAAADQKGEASVIGPASLKGNFKKEKKKHNVDAKIDYSSYAKPEPKSKDLLIYDEAHRMGRMESQRSKYTDDFKARKKLLLTGTPIRNEPSELIPLLRGTGLDIPRNKEKFYDKYVKTEKKSPGFIGRLKGIKPGETQRGKNIVELAEKLKGRVDYHANGKEHYPEVDEKIVKVPMSDKQKATYEMAMKGNPSLAYKVKHGIPPSKEESSQMNAFLTATRQISNTPSSYNESSDPVKDSTKIQRMRDDILEKYKKDKNYKGVTYSNYLDSGVNPLEKSLKDSDIPYAKFTGNTTKKQRKEIVEKYNKGDIKHLLISGAGSEGLDLKGTKMLQVMEPHWNESRIDQVKGRPIRYKSHAGLPKDQRNIDVRHYRSVYGPDSKKKTTDQYLAQLSKQKEKLNSDFKQALILGSALSNETISDEQLVKNQLKGKKMKKKKSKKAAENIEKKASFKVSPELATKLEHLLTARQGRKKVLQQLNKKDLTKYPNYLKTEGLNKNVRSIGEDLAKSLPSN